MTSSSAGRGWEVVGGSTGHSEDVWPIRWLVCNHRELQGLSSRCSSAWRVLHAWPATTRHRFCLLRSQRSLGGGRVYFFRSDRADANAVHHLFERTSSPSVTFNPFRRSPPGASTCFQHERKDHTFVDYAWTTFLFSLSRTRLVATVTVQKCWQQGGQRRCGKPHLVIGTMCVSENWVIFLSSFDPLPLFAL